MLRAKHKRVSYLHVTPGFGKTWVIIHLAIKLSREKQNVIIVTVEKGLQEQMKDSLRILPDDCRDIQCLLSNEIDRYIG